MTSSDRGQDLELSEHEDQSTSRPRAATTSSKASASQPKSSPDRSQKHSRTRSELPPLGSRGRTKSGSELVKGSSSKDGQRSAQTSSTSSVGRSSVGTQLSRGSGSRYLQSHLSMSSVGVEDESSSQSEADEPDPQECPTNPAHMISVLRPATADTTDTRDSQAHRTFLNMEEESEDESNDEDTPSPSSDMEKHKTSGPDAGSTLGSLVDRLLSLPTTKQEANFLPIFLCLYRKFATPKKVLTTIVERFEEIEKSKTVPTPPNERLRSGRERSEEHTS